MACIEMALESCNHLRDLCRDVLPGIAGTTHQAELDAVEVDGIWCLEVRPVVVMSLSVMLSEKEVSGWAEDVMNVPVVNGGKVLDRRLGNGLERFDGKVHGMESRVSDAAELAACDLLDLGQLILGGCSAVECRRGSGLQDGLDAI